ncbi:High affinity cAMP-specific and IBMX-insensitive 3',5'-cyclic phosphodiesterase 8B [Chionoecetes opilio]|uniref:3',5'-cyclic-AMP phosphodiesterase n=1 Tax=Chionoecetes opilio TaxID=41210 RepID=A0A8J5CQU6_CHIOP|nr:High affinity cAMP-specific and IBMX-insensitive 3',5'-cyclic phosphodiesterase 8B [Chionoecetes opilio]
MRGMQKDLRVLLVFVKDDGVCQAWRTAALRQNHSVTHTRTLETAVKAYNEETPDLVVVDVRSAKSLSGVAVCGGLRNAEAGNLAVVVGVVKRRAPAWAQSLNELVQIEQCELATQTQMWASQAVLSALDGCREVVHITDTQHRIKYVNKACETLLGYTLEDVSGRSVWEIHSADLPTRPWDNPRPSLEYRQPPQTPMEGAPLDTGEAVSAQLRRGREWEGVVTCRRRSGGALHLPSKVIPVTPLSRRAQYYVYLMDTHVLDRLELSAAAAHDHPHFHPRGSIKSLRKGSHDIRSLSSDDYRPQGIIRRQSLVKLHSLTLEAPITRVFSIITAAQENSPAYVAQALEKAVEILRSTELYAPQLVSATASANAVEIASGSASARPVHSADPVQGPKPLLSVRRSSNDTAVKVAQQLPRPPMPPLNEQASAAIRELLAEDMSWNFDIFKLEKISDKRPLVWLGMSLMCRFDLPDTLGCDESTLQNWLTLIEANYHADNSYHNSTHAADVLQSTAYFLSRDRLKQLLDPLDVAACLVAAVIHDVDHPGKNSAFLCNTNNELAVLYNDISVLESHHVAVSFKHTRSDDRVNIFKALDRDTYKHVRKSIVDMVLATDMTRHFEHLSKFINMAGGTTTATTGGGDGVFEDDPALTSDLMSFGSPENLVIMKRMLIKCADVSNPLRPLPLSIDWAYRIANEYFNQSVKPLSHERFLPSGFCRCGVRQKPCLVAGTCGFCRRLSLSTSALVPQSSKYLVPRLSISEISNYVS